MGMPMDPVSTTIDAAAWKYLLPGFFFTIGLCGVRTDCATYERSIPFCRSAVQRTNGAFHFADRLCNVRTERSILRIGCAAYGRGIPFCRSAVQRTDGAFHFTGGLCSVRTEHSLLRIGCATYGPAVQSTNESFCFTNALPRYLFDFKDEIPDFYNSL